MTLLTVKNNCVTDVPYVVITIPSSFSSFVTYRRICNENTIVGDTNGAGTDNPSRSPEFTSSIIHSMLYYVVFCGSLFVFLSFFVLRYIVLSLISSFRLPPFVSSNISLNSDVHQFHQYQINENRRSFEISERKNDRDII